MLWRKHQNQPQWEATDQIIDKWLHERQALLVQYYAVCNLNPDTDGSFEPERLQEFCESLVDYVSAGHFEVFEKLADASALSNAEEIKWDREDLVQILRTTMHALDFNDKYSDNTFKKSLHNDLSFLGEQLSHRLDLEDKLITSYLKATHKLSELS